MMSKKRVLILAAFAVTVLLGIACLTACTGDTDSNCAHTWNEWKTVVSPTCTEQGEMRRRGGGYFPG